MDEKWNLYDPLKRVALRPELESKSIICYNDVSVENPLHNWFERFQRYYKDRGYSSFQLPHPIGSRPVTYFIDNCCKKETELFLLDRSNPCTPFFWIEKMTMNEFKLKYKTDMNYFILKPKGRYAVQWKGFNLTEIIELIPGASSSLDQATGDLTLNSLKMGTIYLSLRDWLLGPDGPDGRIETRNAQWFYDNYEQQGKEQKSTTTSGLFMPTKLSSNLGDPSPHPVMDGCFAPNVREYPKSPDSAYVSAGGQVQGGSNLRQ